MHKVSLMMTVVLAAALAACGGGGDDSGAGDGGTGGGGTGGGGTVTLSCNTANYTAGAVSVATEADLAAYAGTFDGEEGTFDVNFNFVKTGDAQMVLSGSGEMTYKGQAHAVTSYCVDNTAGPFGKLLYIEFADGHFDISLTDAGADLRWAWGVAPDGSFFRNGVKQ
ncbi:hypothetical protein [Rubrivivax albus]|uniref:Lipoprotein n=1 Tax=Rubrivivax albus TaxID=2499835 RepID=A0A437JMS3_9BURK|nr:hypothetical protein [Rubrivivax albus]RVT48090.1 hypothetical protein ENE75_23155 [Rubrivivax albus]